MPPTPSHRSSFKGHEISLDVLRLRHKQPAYANEYVGQIRSRLARQLGCTTEVLRLMCSGGSTVSVGPV
jgi:hypothetical protein